MEYGSVAYMGAAEVHLAKLTQVQYLAEKLGEFRSEPLSARRKAAAMSTTLKLLGGRCRGGLENLVPALHHECAVVSIQFRGAADDSLSPV